MWSELCETGTQKTFTYLRQYVLLVPLSLIHPDGMILVLKILRFDKIIDRKTAKDKVKKWYSTFKLNEIFNNLVLLISTSTNFYLRLICFSPARFWT